MPTGTTQPIANGNLSLGDFLERAAKNFIPYNDGEPITRQPKDQNSAVTRHLLELEQAQAELSAAIRRTDEEWTTFYSVLWQEIDRFREFEAEEPSLVLPSKENAHVLP